MDPTTAMWKIGFTNIGLSWPQLHITVVNVEITSIIYIPGANGRQITKQMQIKKKLSRLIQFLE